MRRIVLIVALMAGAAGLCIRHAAAEPLGDSSTRSEVSQAWEDLLLLEAVRYLRLSRSQLRQLVPLAREAKRHLQKLESKQRRTVALAQQLTDRNRALLVDGQAGRTTDESRLLFFQRTLAEQREQAQGEVVGYIVPRLAQILTREQIQLAYQLAVGEKPKNQVVSPALFDPSSGFVLAPPRPGRNRERQVKSRLVARFRPQPQPGKNGRFADVSVTRLETLVDWEVLSLSMVSGLEPLALSFYDVREGMTSRRFPPAERRRREQERQRSQEEIFAQAEAKDLADALRPFTRRFFLSSRCLPVLQDRLGRRRR